MGIFTPPRLGLEPSSTSTLRTLPEIVDFHGENNPYDLFCIQAEKDGQSVPVSYQNLQLAIGHCQAWLQQQGLGRLAASGQARVEEHNTKCAPVAILMESHIGLAIYVLACMGLGVPVVLLSTRLSKPAIRHLARSTGAEVILASARLRSIALEALSETDDSGMTADRKDPENIVVLVREYEKFLARTQVENASRPPRTALPGHFISEQDRQVLILHSSGTSGLPKPIPCSHRYFLSYATCHRFANGGEARALTVSTLPLFHGFGFISICLSLGAGKTVLLPPPSVIPTGASITALIQDFGARALLTVPSTLEEIEALPGGKGRDVLRNFDFVAFGAGMPKESVGARLESAGVKLANQYGSTETGPLTTISVPGKENNWRRFKLRGDILGPLQVRLDRVESQPVVFGAEQTYAYKLSLQPSGWQDRFELQDLVVSDKEYLPGDDIADLDLTIAGRTDDLICLATGEKVRPTVLEALLRQQDAVRDAAAFGANRFELGVVIESSTPLKTEHDIEVFRDSLWPIVEEAGHHMDAHAKITSPAAVLIVDPGSLPRSDKGSLIRNEVEKKFELEIAQIYRRLEDAGNGSPLDLDSLPSSIRSLVESFSNWGTHEGTLLDDDDFFVLGMDSLQATRLRRSLAASVGATHEQLGPEAQRLLVSTDSIKDDFIYVHPSINMIVQALQPQHATIEAMVPDSEVIKKLVDEYTVDNLTGDQGQQGHVVVLSGTTGSLGSFLLQELISSEAVSRVICLNRPVKGRAPLESQKSAMEARGITISDDQWAKVDMRHTQTAAPRLGLEVDDYDRLAAQVTHIVHVAWPMSFKMGLHSFKPAFKSLQNMIQLARAAYLYRPRPKKPRVLFISSISTVGNFPSLQPELSKVPEVIIEDPATTLELGYAKAKLVCENMMHRAAQCYPEIEAGFVRSGQISGASTGYWNTNEHFVAVVASSQKIGKFPDLKGTLSWLPVDSAAKVISEILFHPRPLQLVYHLENPVRQSWPDTVTSLTRLLQIPGSSIITMESWLGLVEADRGSDNPAAPLVQFLREDFLQMSCGSVVLDMSHSHSVSPTLANMGPVQECDIEACVSYWKNCKLLR